MLYVTAFKEAEWTMQLMIADMTVGKPLREYKYESWQEVTSFGL